MKKLVSPFRKLISVPFVITIVLTVSVFFISADFKDNSFNFNSNKIISSEWNQFQTVTMNDSLTQGTPVNLGSGITLTVDEIMKQEEMLPADYFPNPRPRTNPEFEIERPDKQSNPNAPDVSQWPPVNADQKNPESEQTDNPQTLGTSFLGQNISVSSGYIPPDSQGDVGPSQVMTITNGRIRIYSKAGVLGGLNADLDAFFLSVAGATGVSDPHVRYDRLSGRWFIVAINLQAAPNKVVIAVSSGSVITNTSSFTLYSFLMNTGGATSGFADYPTLGVDKFALYVGMNIFNAAGTAFLGTNGYVINKANLIGGTLTVTSFNLLVGTGAGIYTPQGADNDDPSATQGYFVGVDNAAFSLLVIKRVSNPGGTPSISANLNLTVPTTVYPIAVPCLGTTGNLDALDDRLFAAEVHKNKITGAITLWTAHNIQVNTSGVGSNSGGRNGSRWYEITNLTSTPALNQSGTLFDNAASNPRSYWIPSTAMSGQGHMAIASTTGGTGKRAEIYGAGRLRTDANGTTQTATLLQSSSTAYNVEGSGTQRWGDYSQTVVDPNDDQTMWTFQEYCDANNSWGIRAIQLKAPLPATPSSSNIVNIETGMSSVNIIITGTSVGGTEFFDPGADAGGPGFANHIAATISGSVTVNSITFTDPTHVTLNISTVGSPLGNKNITVTNPDGQTATGNNLINIISHTPVTYNFTSLIQGFYDPSTDLLVQDTMRVYLRNSTSPYAVIDSGKAYLSASGTGSVSFANGYNSISYYIQFKHRNSIQTWSSSPGQSFVANTLTYDLSSAAAQAFGNNQKLVDSSPVKYAVYGGDSNQDGTIDASDVSSTENDASVNLSGYVQTDYTGDNYVDGSDLSLVENNAEGSVVAILP